MKWYQENGTLLGHQNLLACRLVRTALVPIHTRSPHGQESLDKMEGTYGMMAGIVAEPNNKNLPPQTEEKPSPETGGCLSF